MEEAKGEDKPAEQAAPSSESKPVEEAKGEDKPAEQVAPLQRAPSKAEKTKPP